jgi:lipid-binding SYLF domain-containing protein
MLVMNEKGLKRLLSDEFSIGVDATAAAGPVGRYAAANTDILMNAEILTWSRARGGFAGVSLNGTVVGAIKRRTRSSREGRSAVRRLFGGKRLCRLRGKC